MDDKDKALTAANKRIMVLERALILFVEDFDRYFGNGPEGRASPKFFDASLGRAREAIRETDFVK